MDHELAGEGPIDSHLLLELLTGALELFVDLSLLSSRLEAIVLLILKQLVFEFLVTVGDLTELVFRLSCLSRRLFPGVLTLEQSNLGVFA